MGKSSCGKDTIYKRLLADETLGLKRLVPYTTRPIRIKEIDGIDYNFVTEDQYLEIKSGGRVLEERAYNTVHGLWRYFTVKEDSLVNSEDVFLYIGTLEAYTSLCKALGNDMLLPIYVSVDDGERLSRALRREMKEATPKYAEMCRRFLADTEDFSDEKLEAAGITKQFDNSDLEECLGNIKTYIKSSL